MPASVVLQGEAVAKAALSQEPATMSHVTHAHDKVSLETPETYSWYSVIQVGALRASNVAPECAHHVLLPARARVRNGLIVF